MRTSDPGAERGGRLHSGVSGVGSGYEFCQPESDASVGCDRGRAWTTAGDSLRQRTGADEPALSGLVRGTADRVSAHTAGKTDAECSGGEFQRTLARRVSGSKLVSESIRCTAEDRSVAKGVQR